LDAQINVISSAVSWSVAVCNVEEENILGCLWDKTIAADAVGQTWREASGGRKGAKYVGHTLYLFSR